MIGSISDVLTLDDDNEYVIVSKINYNNNYYYYLVDINNNKNLMFCYEDDDELVESKDKKLNTKLLPLFLDAATKDIKMQNLLNKFV